MRAVRSPFHEHFRLGGLGALRPSKAALVLMGLVGSLGVAARLWPALGKHLLLAPGQAPYQRPGALLGNSLVSPDGSFIMFALMLALAAWLFWPIVGWYFKTKRAEMIIGVVATLGGLQLANIYLGGHANSGFAWGLTLDLLFLAWFVTPLERMWGLKRTLLFSLWIVLGTNLLGALLLWVWPSGVLPMIGSRVVPLNGPGALLDAFLAVYFWSLGRGRTALLGIEAYKFVWFIIALAVFSVIFDGRIGGLMDLAAIGLAWLLITGNWHPRLLLDRLKLAQLKAREAKRRGRFKVIDGGRTLHFSAPATRFCPPESGCASITGKMRLVLATAMLCIAGLPAPVEAQDTPGASETEAAPATPEAPADAAAPSAASSAYAAGVEHFKAGRYADAIREFNKAYRVDPNPVLVFNMARAFEEMKQYPSAVEFYRKYLEMAPNAKDAETVKQSLRTLELLIAQQASPEQVELTVTSVPDGAKVLLDGRDVGATPLKLKVALGKHFVTVEKAGFTREASELTFEKGADQTHAVTLVAVAEAPPPPPPASNVLAWTLIGTGGALMLGGAVTGTLALQKEGEVDDFSGSRDDFDALQDEGNTLALMTDGLLAGGVVSATVGLVLLLSGDDQAQAGTHMSAPARATGAY